MEARTLQLGKTLLYRLFRLGAIPKSLKPALEAEGIVIEDEGVGGSFIARDFRAPGRRYLQRRERFSGALVVTKKRVVATTFSKRQINIAVDDPKIDLLHVERVDPETLALSFEASAFHGDQRGVLEFRYRTGRAADFYATLIRLGLQSGRAESSGSHPA